MSDTLRERVARAISDVREPLYDGMTLEAEKDRFRKMADAAIALVLEEAAKVADAENSDWDDYPTFATGWASAAEKIAAAIRALKEGK